MKNKIPFIIPENDINLRIFRFLMIIDQLAYTQRGKLVINIDRLVIFDFLIRNPFILKQVLSIKNNKTNLRLLRDEFETVSTLFPNKIALVDTKSTKEIIKLMIAYKMLKVFQEKDDLFYVLTDKAKLIVNQIDTDYSVRVKELCEAMLVLRSVTINDLKKVINPLVKGI
ncbi:hypothetical protein P4T79_06535 [Bacillus mojavensis]|uniref:ABC-three component system middle component 4 n=1 Tax=Bacillus mojavensis TaxID=72360 RepID=UPI002DBC6974|nr:ABC-three component system middle component 4 [Bacillus mojavensis]MEC1621597.1 hypothetical protein [Bacillus mojavensis]MEC1659765.1 hypothetical protein [Bacillus mojavensis]MEC1732368.1 hypothetical protein [Bacillus mojavensis]MED1006282.1 hypothetical protein [Bacillus mojavensis]